MTASTSAESDRAAFSLALELHIQAFAFGYNFAQEFWYHAFCSHIFRLICNSISQKGDKGFCLLSSQ